MVEQAARKLDLNGKLLLGIAGIAAIATVFFSLIHVAQVRAQSPAENPTQNIADTWQGTLRAGRDLRTVVKISKADGGGYKAVFYSIDQGGDGIPVTKITLEGTTVKMSLTAIGGTYEGKLSSDGKSIVGSWSQGPNPLPLNLARATPETEWTIPAPTPKLPPMDANASPRFEVATIKPSKPDEPGKALPSSVFTSETTRSLKPHLPRSFPVLQVGLEPCLSTSALALIASLQETTTARLRSLTRQPRRHLSGELPF